MPQFKNFLPSHPVLNQAIQEFWLQVILSTGWATYQAWGSTTPISDFAKNWAIAFTIISFMVMQYFRIKRQQYETAEVQSQSDKIDSLENHVKTAIDLIGKLPVQFANNPSVAPLVKDLSRVTEAANTEVGELRTANNALREAQNAAVMSWFGTWDTPLPLRSSGAHLAPAITFTPSPLPSTTEEKQPEKSKKRAKKRSEP